MLTERLRSYFVLTFKIGSCNEVRNVTSQT